MRFQRYLFHIFALIFCVAVLFSSPVYAFLLLPSGFISGTVRNAADGEIVPNAEVRIYDNLFFNVTITADSSGYYEYTSDICGTDVNVEVDIDGFQKYQSTVFLPCYGSVSHDIYLLPVGAQAGVNPVVVIPGIAGSELLLNDEEIWMNVWRMARDTGDDGFLRVLEMNDSGEQEEDIEVGGVIREKELFSFLPDFII